MYFLQVKYLYTYNIIEVNIPLQSNTVLHFILTLNKKVKVLLNICSYLTITNNKQVLTGNCGKNGKYYSCLSRKYSYYYIICIIFLLIFFPQVSNISQYK